MLLEPVRSEVAVLLGLAGPRAVAAEQTLRKVGLDSLTAIESRNRLTPLVGAPPPTTLLFDDPTRARVAGDLATQLRSAANPPERESFPGALHWAELERWLEALGREC